MLRWHACINHGGMRKMKRLSLCAVPLAMLTFLQPTNAGLSILIDDGSEATLAKATKNWNVLAGGWDIVLKDLYNPGGETIYNIIGTGGEIINIIVIDVPCWTNSAGDCAPAGSPVFIKVLHGDAGGIQTIRRIIQTNDAETFLLRAEAREDIGEVVVEVITEIYAGRDVIGPIISTTEDNSVRGIFTVDAERNILGDVKAPNGRIAGVRAQGSIGRPGAPITIESKYLMFGVHSVTGTYAHVNTRINGGTGGLVTMSGPIFEGSLVTSRLPVNPFDGSPSNLVFTERVSADLIIGGSFGTPNGWIEVPRGGFDGRIIINADNFAGGEWVNPVHFGDASDPDRITLTDSNYQVTASVLGGGSIGLVPFSLHNESSYPINGATVQNDQIIGVTTRLRHYGPIQWNSGDPVTIEWRDQGSTGPFSMLSLVDFDLRIDNSDSNTLLIGPKPDGQGGFVEGHEYRISATSNLLCDVASLAPVAWEQPYVFVVESSAAVCIADVSGDQVVNVLDLLQILTSWGPVTSSTQTADITGDGIVNVVDLLALLTNWGSCP